MEEARPSLSLILPAFNESEGIATAAIEADEALRQFTDDYEILIVDDGSTDTTAAIVNTVARDRPRIRLLQHEHNCGYGAALRTGFEAARGDRIAFTDADGQFDLSELPRLIRLADRYPIVVGYRVDRQDPWQRRFYSWGYNQLVRRLIGTGVCDCDCALKVYRRDAVARILPESTHFFVNTEMLARARQLDLEVAEVGVTHRPRRHGHSKVSLADIPRTLGVLLPFWWSRVLFRQAHRDFQTGASAFRPLTSVLFLMVLASLLFFCRLRTPLLEPEEARYAEIPRQMLAADRWLVPVLHGQDYLDKPPLFYWLMMTAYQAFGVGEETARGVAGTIALFTILAVFGWGWRTMGARPAFLAALVLVLSPEFVYRGRMVTTNGFLALCTTAALAAGHVARYGPRLRMGWWVVSGMAAGLGLLTKGPVAMALVVPPLLAVGWLDRRLARVGVVGWAVFLATTSAVATPWYVAVALRHPEFGAYFFWFHNVQRFVDPFDHAKPMWFYGPQILLGLLPWTLLFIPLARILTGRSGRIASRRPGALGVALVAAIWGLVFFSLAGSKRPVYLLPVLPPIALALGCSLDLVLPNLRLAPWWAVLVRYRSAIAYYATAVMLAAAFVIGVGAFAVDLRKGERGLTLAIVGGIGLAALAHRPRRATWLTAGAATFTLLWVGTHDLLPGYANRFSLRRAARPETVASAVYCYPQPFDAVSFYLRRNDVRTFRPAEMPHLVAALRDRPGALLFVKSTHVDELRSALPAALRFVTEGHENGVTVGRVLTRPIAPVTGYARGGDVRGPQSSACR